MPRAPLAACLTLCMAFALPAAAQTAKPQPVTIQPDALNDNPALTCANLFNWVVRFGEGLPFERRDRLQSLLSSIADPQVYAVPSQDDCASVLQIMVQEGFDISALGLHEVAGVTAQCDAVVPFVQQRYLSLGHENQTVVLEVMEAVNVPLYGRSDDLMACAIVHGTLDRLNLFEVMQEF